MIVEVFPHGANIGLRCRYTDKDRAKAVPGAKWDAAAKFWTYPACPEVLVELRRLFPQAKIAPNVDALVAEEVRRRQVIAATKAARVETIEPLRPMPVKNCRPYRHQIAAYNIAITIPVAALLMEQGTGKTLTAIAAAGRRYLDGDIRKVLVVAPASVVPVWQNEFKKYADFPFEIETLTGAVAAREAVLRSWRVPNQAGALMIAVTNYEAVWRMEDALLAWGADMVIADEMQRIKSPSARQSKAMHRIGAAVKYRLGLSGTPIVNKPLDVFSQYKFLAPNIFGNSFYAFRARYAIMGGYGRHEVVGYKNMDELQEKLHSIAYRVTKAEALDLPEAVDQTLYCDLEPAAKNIYRQLARQAVAELGAGRQITAQIVLTKLLRLSQLTGGFVRTDDGEVRHISSAKLALLRELLADLLEHQDRKVVIFARFVPELTAIRRILEVEGIKHSYIAGNVVMSDRGAEVERFQSDPACRVFLAQTRAAGLGITLTAADTAIFYSLDYSYADYDQARARIHRAGQNKKCTYIHLVASGTVDEKVLAALAEKRDVAEQIVDTWRELLHV